MSFILIGLNFLNSEILDVKLVKLNFFVFGDNNKFFSFFELFSLIVLIFPFSYFFSLKESFLSLLLFFLWIGDLIKFGNFGLGIKF